MKKIGLIGGMSWESTRTYYSHLNGAVKGRLGGLNSAEILLASVNFAPLEAAMRRGDWDFIADEMCRHAKSLEAGGADCLLLCTNTMHKCVGQIEAAVAIPLLHIADALAADLVRGGVDTVGLLGTRFTMVEDFYAKRLRDKFGVSVLIPDDGEIAEIDRIIFAELCQGVVREESRVYYLSVMDELAQRGAGSIALACTEIEMLIGQDDTEIPLHDTTKLHAEYAVNWAMGEGAAA